MQYQIDLRDAGSVPTGVGLITLIWTQPPVMAWHSVYSKVSHWLSKLAEHGTVIIARYEFSHEGILTMVGDDIAQYTEPGDLVVDPFCGTGTTGLAALRLGRRFYGCDISQSAVNLSRDRLKSEHN